MVLFMIVIPDSRSFGTPRDLSRSTIFEADRSLRATLASVSHASSVSQDNARAHADSVHRAFYERPAGVDGSSAGYRRPLLINDLR